MASETCGWCGHQHEGCCEADADTDGNHPGAICGCRRYRCSTCKVQHADPSRCPWVG